MLTAEGVSELICLTCPQHEEADTRIFAHAAYSASNQGCTRVVIKATDTDTAVLGVYHSQRMPGLKELWIQKSVTAQNPDIPTSVFLTCHQITDVLSSKYPEVDIASVVQAAYTIQQKNEPQKCTHTHFWGSFFCLYQQHCFIRNAPHLEYMPDNVTLREKAAPQAAEIT